MSDALPQPISLFKLLRIQFVIGVLATVIGYPFLAIFWAYRHGFDVMSISGVFRDILIVLGTSLATGLAMAVMALVAYPGLKIAYRKGWLSE
jgi:hypothetical protein